MSDTIHDSMCTPVLTSNLVLFSVADVDVGGDEDPQDIGFSMWTSHLFADKEEEEAGGKRDNPTDCAPPCAHMLLPGFSSRCCLIPFCSQCLVLLSITTILSLGPSLTFHFSHFLNSLIFAHLFLIKGEDCVHYLLNEENMCLDKKPVTK